MLLKHVEKSLGIEINKEKIEVMEIASPRTYERYLANKFGTGYGFDPTPDQVGMSRPARKTPIKNLWLAGQWTQPGHSFTGCQASGWLAAKEMLGK